MASRNLNEGYLGFEDSGSKFNLAFVYKTDERDGTFMFNYYDKEYTLNKSSTLRPTYSFFTKDSVLDRVGGQAQLPAAFMY